MMQRMALVAAMVAGQAACAQSLFQRMVDDAAPLGARTDLRATSMYLVEPPEPRVYRVHDLITVIVNENSKSSSDQSLDTTKESKYQDKLNGILDPMQLLELRLQGSNLSALDLLSLQAKHEFKGDGKYDRSDQLSAQIAAEVIDVKPNGTLVLEAKKSIVTDGESKVFVLSGLARQEDITDSNTVLSSQLANLRLDVQHEGQLRESAEKGLFTRVLDTLFNF
ncbi:MAG: flagellar basal body L-ring protein FlgH [Phycisphaeraceae bacterium]|nr:MAG: flagellar basal body L-ring protein FlgH [Phycisphaeraceae bacterium]